MSSASSHLEGLSEGQKEFVTIADELYAEFRLNEIEALKAQYNSAANKLKKIIPNERNVKGEIFDDGQISKIISDELGLSIGNDVLKKSYQKLKNTLDSAEGELASVDWKETYSYGILESTAYAKINEIMRKKTQKIGKKKLTKVDKFFSIPENAKKRKLANSKVDKVQKGKTTKFSIKDAKAKYFAQGYSTYHILHNGGDYYLTSGLKTSTNPTRITVQTKGGQDDYVGAFFYSMGLDDIIKFFDSGEKSKRPSFYHLNQDKKKDGSEDSSTPPSNPTLPIIPTSTSSTLTITQPSTQSTPAPSNGEQDRINRLSKEDYFDWLYEDQITVLNSKNKYRSQKINFDSMDDNLDHIGLGKYVKMIQGDLDTLFSKIIYSVKDRSKLDKSKAVKYTLDFDSDDFKAIYDELTTSTFGGKSIGEFLNEDQFIDYSTKLSKKIDNIVINGSASKERRHKRSDLIQSLSLHVLDSLNGKNITSGYFEDSQNAKKAENLKREKKFLDVQLKAFVSRTDISTLYQNGDNRSEYDVKLKKPWIKTKKRFVIDGKKTGLKDVIKRYMFGDNLNLSNKNGKEYFIFDVDNDKLVTENSLLLSINKADFDSSVKCLDSIALLEGYSRLMGSDPLYVQKTYLPFERYRNPGKTIDTTAAILGGIAAPLIGLGNFVQRIYSNTKMGKKRFEKKWHERYGI